MSVSCHLANKSGFRYRPHQLYWKCDKVSCEHHIHKWQPWTFHKGTWSFYDHQPLFNGKEQWPQSIGRLSRVYTVCSYTELYNCTVKVTVIRQRPSRAYNLTSKGQILPQQIWLHVIQTHRNKFREHLHEIKYWQQSDSESAGLSICPSF